MRRLSQALVPVAVLACALAGMGKQRKHPPKPKALAAEAPSPSDPQIQAIRANNIGLALMDRQQFSDALGKFQIACILDSRSYVGCLNMGIAFLQMQRYDDARRVLTKYAAQYAENPRVWFNLGLLDKAVDEPKAAIRDFEKTAALDAADADTQYFLGALYSSDREYAKATAAFSEAVKLNPFYASAELGLAQVAQQTGDTDRALAHLNRFRHIVSDNLGEPIRAAYGEQGKYSRAQELPRAVETVPQAIGVHFVNITRLSGLDGPFGSAGAEDRLNRSKNGRVDGARIEPDAETRSDVSSGSLASFLGSGACIIDYNMDGKPDIVLVNADGKGNAALFRNAGGEKFVDVTKEAKLEFHGNGTGCAVGDYDNDGYPDLAVSSSQGVSLYHNEGNGTFKDVSDAAGFRAEGGLSLGLTFIDYDNDGDLDLYITRFTEFPLRNPSQPFSFPETSPPPGNILWRNKGDGTFMDWTKATALAGKAPSIGAIGSDVNNDRAADLVVGGWEKSPTLFLNEPEGGFHAESPWTTDMPGPTAGVIAFDFDKDGWMDLAFTHWASPGLSLWRNIAGKSFERVSLPGPEWMRGWGLAALDYDNDGWIDLAAVGENFAGEGRIILLRNEGPRGFRDVTQETGLDKIELHDPRSLIACDFDGDGSTDLLITQNNRPPVLLKSDGGNKNNWLRIALKGEFDSKTGIGTKIELFAGLLQQKWELPGASGYLGQGPAEILAGLGSESEVDVLRLFWPTGVLQDDLQIRGGARTVLAEFDPRDAQP